LWPAYNCLNYRKEQLILKESQGDVSRLYKHELTESYNLVDALNILRKEQLDSIRQSLYIKGVSALNKAELVKSLARLIPDHLDKIFSWLSEERYNILKNAAENGGIIANPDLPFKKVDYFARRGLLFPGHINSQKVLFMPPEIKAVFMKYDSPKLMRLARMNGEFLTIVKGLLYFYGVIDYHNLFQIMRRYVDFDPESIDYIGLLCEETDYDFCILPSFDRCSHVKVEDPEYVFAEQAKRPEIPYKHIPRKLLKDAANPDFMDRNEQFNDLVDFLVSNYDIPKDEAETLVDECILLMKQDEHPAVIMEYLKELFLFPSLDFLYMLTHKLSELHNNTRQWILKGHTSKEVFDKFEKNQVKPGKENPGENNEALTNIIDMRTRKRIASNSPCPCGSGKPYKMCCGRDFN